MHQLLNDMKKTVVFFGKDRAGKGIFFFATGALLLIHDIYHLVTAKHVVFDQETERPKDEGVQIFFNSKTRDIKSCSLDRIKKDYGVKWIFHDDKNIDVAMMPISFEPNEDDVKIIHEDMFLTTDDLNEVQDIFFLAYQPGIEPKKKISPIIRGGIISLINEDRTFYVDACAFPGNSGCPVFVKPMPIRYSGKGGTRNGPVSIGDISMGPDPLGGKFIGIIGQYIPYQEIAISTQTERPRIIFEENTGLARVWSVGHIREIVKSSRFKEQLTRLSPTESGTN